jgi:hypothetical protein
MWKPLPSDPLYEISNTGLVRNIQTGRLLKPTPHKGYWRVRLRNKRVLLHVLVAEAFFGPAPEGYEVNHKNGNKADCDEGNLEYLTRSDNVKHAFRTGLKKNKVGDQNWHAKLTTDNVIAIRAEAAADRRSYNRLATQYQVSRQCIEAIVYRRTWKHIA